MRKIIVSTLFSALVLTSACKKPDPNKFETHIELIKNADTRSQGFSGLETLTATVLDAQDNDDLIDDFATKVIPAFEEIYADAEEQQEKMLDLLRKVGRPEAAPVWNMALELDGSAGARKKVMTALDGIKKAKADGSVEKMIALNEEIIGKPALDEDGKVRLRLAETMGVVGSKLATPVLIKVMEQPKEKQPVMVHRAAATALGRIADPAAVDALLTVTFRVPDAPADPTNVGVRARQSLGAIGEPAVPAVLKMLRGDHIELQELAAKNGVAQGNIQQTAASILGTMGAVSAVEDLQALMPTADCQPEDGKNEEEVADAAAAAGLRGVIANALGFIGDPRPVAALCSCSMASKNPGDMHAIMQALGRIGGPEAVACLNEVVKAGEYDTEVVMSDFKYEPRWEAARFAVLAAGPGEVASIKEAIATNKDKKVTTETSKWDAGIALLESCKEDAACYRTTLEDVNADWFAREKAAFMVAKLKAGDVDSAVAVSKAFKVRNASARENIAWLPASMLESGTECAGCVEAFQSIIKAEINSLPGPEYLTGIVRARDTIAALRPASDAGAQE